VLKNRRRIDDVTSLLSGTEIRGSPTLIIDDEGDEASLNNQFRRGMQSPIYASINRLRGSLECHAYIAYTATPQANLLISNIDALSPDFGVLVEPGESYCGGAVFFGPDRDLYVRELPADEGEFDPENPTPQGLQSTLATFVIGGVIRHLRNPNDWHSMLIHNSHRTANHSRLREALSTLLTRWKDTLGLPETDPAKITLLRIFREAYDEICRTVHSAPTWEEVRNRLHEELWLIELMMVNSLPQGRDPIETPFRLPNSLLVGGNMLSRGLTIPGLATTYITRRAQDTNTDTMEQRARWFGYKRNYLDVCRIFLTHQLREDYTVMLNLEDDFWEALRRNERQGLSIRAWRRMFALDMSLGLRPTRASVANYRQFRGSGWDAQNKPVEDDTLASANVRAVESFFHSHPSVTRHWGTTEHSIIAACPTGDVVSQLLANVNCDGTDWDSAYNEEYLARLLLRGVLPTIEVVYMSCGQLRDRTKRDGRVNPMQGSNREPGDPDYYPGDEHFHNDRMQLQVHLINMTIPEISREVRTTAFALYVPPNDSRFNLGFVVRSESHADS
jgi:hypothetical protein